MGQPPRPPTPAPSLSWAWAWVLCRSCYLQAAVCREAAYRVRKCPHTVNATYVLNKIHSAAEAILFFCFFY